MTAAEKNPEPVLIDALSQDGRGVAHIDGKAVFIAGALPGERVTLGRRWRHRRFDEAEVDSIVEASAQRVAPRCGHFGVCGGCSLQHLQPQAQVDFKERELLEQLQRIGRVEPRQVLPALRDADPWHYRRRARVGAKFVPKKDRVLVGFRERGKPYITELSRCEVLAEPVGSLIEPLARVLTDLSVRACIPQIEVAVADNATALVLRVLEPPTAQDRQALAGFAARHGVRVYLQPGGLQSIAPLDGEDETQWEPLLYRLPEYDLELEFSPTDFVQINGPVNRRLVSQALEWLSPEPGERVLDLFCGLGNFTLPLARRCAQVVGVEGDERLVEQARRNAQRNGIVNAQFHAANLYGPPFLEEAPAAGPALPWMQERFDKVLLDPPRAGAREVLPWIGRCAANRLVYISCHPASLARDAGILVHEMGFRLQAAGAVDMFPHTGHVESMAVFER